MFDEGPVTQCDFSCNLQRNSTVGRCEIGKYLSQTFVINLHLLRVELDCKLQERLRRVTQGFRKQRSLFILA